MLNLLGEPLVDGIDLLDPVADDPLNHGLSGWWLVLPGLKGGHRWHDLTRHTRHGTLTNMAPAADWLGPRGRRGGWGSLDFDASTDYVAVADAGLPSGGAARTLMGWGRTDAAFNGFMLNYGSGGDGTTVYFGQYDLGSGRRSILGVGGVGSNISGDTVDPFADGGWHQIAAVYDGSSMWHLYLDGEEDGSGTPTTGTNTTLLGTLRLGLAVDDSQGWNGQLDDVRIYNRVLSASEVADLYDRSRRYNTGLLNRTRRRVWFVPAAAPAGGIFARAGYGGGLVGPVRKRVG